VPSFEPRSTASNAFLSALDRHTLADLVHARPPLRKLLSIAHQRQSYLEKPRPGSGEADPALIR